MKMMHVTIHSCHFEDSVVFYQKVAGLTVQSDLRQPNGMSIVFLANGEGETCVELIDAKEEAAYTGGGISIGFHVDNVVAYREELEAKGYQPTPLLSPNPQVQFFFVKDPNGVTVQFI